MSSPDPEAIASAVVEPLLRRPAGELGMVREASASGAAARVGIVVPSQRWEASSLAAAIADALKRAGFSTVDVEVAFMDDDERDALAARLASERPGPVGGPGSRTRVIAIASGKGGVGKSSITANLAVSLAGMGHDVAVIDADVWGYSIPRMLGIEDPPSALGPLIVPPSAHGVRVISMDFFVPTDEAVVWRGPMLHKALEQFLGDVFWDEPEFLLVDMPPGTGDVAISMSQFLPRSQTIVVTTPQPTAQRVAKRAAGMAAKVNQEVMGVVENMSWFTGDDDQRYELFGAGGGQELADELGVPLLGQVPLVPAMRQGADDGLPVTLAAPESEAASAFASIAERIVALRPRVRTHPELVIR
ncbi:MAG: Mrp/NBP35 family ATP-binding protein [Acidimicrobiia bacterium]|nr:MAG: Mrp/NBP35 family ATP-binding protein [Acidimicrobiia bacterium]